MYSDTFRSQQTIIRENVCTSLKLLNYLKNTEFKISPGVVAAMFTFDHISFSSPYNDKCFKQT